MKFFKKSGITLILVLNLCGLAFTQSLIQPIDQVGYVDWEKLVVRSSGVGSIKITRPDRSQRVEALEAAKQTAAQNLLKVVEAITFNTNFNVKNSIKRKFISSKNLQSVIQGFTIVDTRSMSDMSIEVEVELSITGKVSAVLLPEDCGKGQLRLSNQLLCPTCGQPWPEDKPVPKDVKLINLMEGLKAPNGKPYTGLIIDARGLDVNPAIAPKVIDEDGNEIYGTEYVDRDMAIKNGIVTYKSDIKSAFNYDRVGSEPLVIRGMKASGPLKSDVVISNSDAALIHSAAHLQNFLHECRVVFIIS